MRKLTVKRKIPWGTEDVVLCGQHHFDIVCGNSFRFDK